MTVVSVIAAVVLICSTFTAVTAQSAGQKAFVAQYPIGGGVDKYKNFAGEICSIMDAASAKNFDQVRKIYVKNKKDAGYADSLQAFAQKDFTGMRYYDLGAKYNPEGPGWLDVFFMQALDGTGDFKPPVDANQRVQGILKTAQSAIAIQLMLKELDSASTALGSGSKDGAVKAMDESYAVFATRPACGPFDLGNKYAGQFDTIKDCATNTSTANIKIVNGYINARAAAKKGDEDQFKTSSNAIVAGIIEVHIQAVLNYAKKMSAATDPTKAKELQTEGYVFYRTIFPFVGEANKKAAADILKAIEDDAPSATSYNTIKTLFESTYPALNIDPNNIGTWKDSPSLTCAAKNAAVSLSATASAMFGGLGAAILAAFL